MRIVEFTLPDGKPIAIKAEVFRTAAPNGNETLISLDDGEEITVAEDFAEVVRRFRALAL